jgi:hypothetical protein
MFVVANVGRALRVSLLLPAVLVAATGLLAGCELAGTPVQSPAGAQSAPDLSRHDRARW